MIYARVFGERSGYAGLGWLPGPVMSSVGHVMAAGAAW